jgi:hypothetical protein
MYNFAQLGRRLNKVQSMIDTLEGRSAESDSITFVFGTRAECAALIPQEYRRRYVWLCSESDRIHGIAYANPGSTLHRSCFL